MERHRSRLPLAFMVAVIAAGAATVILRPRSGLIEPAAVDETAYFSQAQLQRASDFRDPQRILGLAGLVVTGGTLALIALRPTRRLDALLDRNRRRPVVAGAVVGAGVSVVLVVAGLPLDAIAHRRAVDVGLSTQGWGPWLADLGKSTAIGAVFAAGGGAAVLAIVRRFRNWWVPLAVLVVGVGIFSTYLLPVAIDPLFNRFDRLPQGKLRSEVLTLADRAGVDVGEVYRVDASRRTTGANAYVNGLGQTKRVVLYDNLIEGFSDDQVQSVVAHELGHVKDRDVPRGLLWLAIVAPAATLLVQRLSERIGDERLAWGDGGRPGAAALPAVALSLALVGFGVSCAGNVLSRGVEAHADAFALHLTGDSDAFIGLERKLAVSNVAQPDPPAALQALFGTHPTTVERIGYGETFARGAR